MGGAFLHFWQDQGCQSLGFCKRDPPPLIAWHGGERERDQAPSLDQNPNVGHQELAPQLPALCEMGCPLYLPKETDNMPIISDFIEKKSN